MQIHFNEEKLKDILIQFHQLTGMRFVFFNADFERIAAYPPESCDFCTRVKQNGGKDACRKDDTIACANAQKRGDIYTYKCHAGLIEVVAPVKMNDTVIGYIMFGQICEKGKDRADIVRYGSRYMPEEEAYAAVQKIIAKSEKQIDAAAYILGMCACYLCMNDIFRTDRESLASHLESYIHAHITEPISVEQLCTVFGISRYKLYEIAEQRFAMPVAEYIRKQKVKLAAQALRTRGCAVSEAAEAGGFSDYNYFSKIFKREMGVLPTEYKKGDSSS